MVSKLPVPEMISINPVLSGIGFVVTNSFAVLEPVFVTTTVYSIVSPGTTEALLAVKTRVSSGLPLTVTLLIYLSSFKLLLQLAGGVPPVQ